MMNILYLQQIKRVIFGVICASCLVSQTYAETNLTYKNYQIVVDKLEVFSKRLNLTVNEQSYWDKYRDSVLLNETNNEKFLELELASHKRSALDYFKERENRVKAFADSIQIITKNFTDLYQHLSPEQRLIADNYFEENRKIK